MWMIDWNFLVIGFLSWETLFISTTVTSCVVSWLLVSWSCGNSTLFSHFLLSLHLTFISYTGFLLFLSLFFQVSHNFLLFFLQFLGFTLNSFQSFSLSSLCFFFSFQLFFVLVCLLVRLFHPSISKLFSYLGYTFSLVFGLKVFFFSLWNHALIIHNFFFKFFDIS
jgi:hypothetical protein